MPSIEHVVNIIVSEWVDVMIAGAPSHERQALDAGTIRNLCLVSRKVRSFVCKAILWTLAIDDVYVLCLCFTSGTLFKLTG